MFEFSLDANTIALENDIFVEIIGLHSAKSEAIAYSWKSVLARQRENEIAQIESLAVDLVNDLRTGERISKMKIKIIDDLTLDLSLSPAIAAAATEAEGSSVVIVLFALGFLSHITNPKIVKTLRYIVGVTGFQLR